MENKFMENKEIRIQDDLYEYVNHDWIEKAVIPDDKPRVGGFSDLSDDVEKILIKDLNEMCEKDEYPNEYLRKACIIYKDIKDVKRRKRLGFKPALKKLKMLDKITDISKLNRKLKELLLNDFSLPFNIFVEEDMKDAKHYCLALSGPSIILPDTTFYKDDMKDKKEALLGIWSSMTSEVLKYTNLSEEDQKKYIEDTLKFDSVIATMVKSREEKSEYTKSYNPMKTSRVCSLLKPIKFKKLLMDLFGFVPEKVVVSDPRFLKEFKNLFNENTFEEYKHWTYVMECLSSTNLLSEELREIGGRFRRALSGTTVMTPLEKYAYYGAGQVFSGPIGLYYGEKYFGEEAKKDVTEMVQEIIETYKKRIRTNSILEESTKERAILKLSTMKVKMGYPDKVNEIFDLIYFNEDGNLYEKYGEIDRICKEYSFSRLGKDVNYNEWVMPGHMVNACYNPTANDITFPAAILQAPFYSIKQSRSQNLGGIGAVIGHEISHAFDNNGANIDENGNLNNWWTKEDFKRFKKCTNAMIKQFDGIELPWGKVNGKFIVSENIADNGGMAVTLDIMSGMTDANYEEYFMNWARVWCMKARVEFLKLLLAVDVHGPTVLRANMPPRNFEEWYKTFNVKKTDKMYLAPSKRVVIW